MPGETPMRHGELVTAYWTRMLSQADAIKEVLRSDGIPCILGGSLRARWPAIPTLDIHVKVPATFLTRARQLIEGCFPGASAD